MQKVLSGNISDVQCLSSSGTVGKSSSLSGLSEYTGVLSGTWSWYQCEGTVYMLLVGQYIVLCLFLDNSGSPSIVEQ